MAYQPKSYKKFVATAATATLVATAVAPTALAADFTDVNANYKNAVDYLVDQGIANGLTETTFGVTSPIKRGDAAIMIAKALGLNTTTAPDAGFTDVNARVAGAVNAIVEAGIASGKTSTTFAPDLYITRQETAKMIANAYGLTGSGTTKFTDVNSNWAPFVSALEQAGIAQGLNETTFGATNDVTRGQFALFLYRAEGQPYEVAAVESLTFNAEGNQFVLKFAEALPEGADLNYVLENYSILLNGVAPTAAQLEALKLSATVSADRTTVTVSHTDLDDLASTLGGTSATLSVGGKSDTHTFVVTPEVTSVSAINGGQLVVKFTADVDGTSAETPSNYSLSDGKTVSDATVLEDGKSVLLTLSSAYDNKAAHKVAVTVQDVVIDGTVDTKFPVFTQVITVEDKVAAQISSASSVTKDDATKTVVVKFSEPVQSGAAFKINGVSVSNATYNSSFTSVTLTAQSNLEVGKTHKVEAVNLTDRSGNVTPVASQTFNVTKDATAPVVESVVPYSDSALLVTFNKDMKNDLTALNNMASNIKVKNDVYADVTVSGVTQLGGDSETQFVVQLQKTGATSPAVDASSLYSSTKTSHNLTVLFINDTIEDYLGNKLAGVSKTVTLTKDTVAPEVTGISYKKNSAGKVTSLVVNFNEGLKAGTLTFPTNIVNENGVVVTSASVFGTIGNATVSQGAKKATFNITSGTEKTVTGKYSISLAAGWAKDASLAENDSKAYSAVVDFGAGQTVGEYDVTSATTTSPNVITVVFPEGVKGGAVSGSATDPARYTVNGASLPSGTSITLNAAGSPTSGTVAQTIATITLPAGTISATDSAAIFTVNGVQTLTGKTNKPFTTTVSVTDNVKPELLSAKVLDNKTIELTYSEAINTLSTTHVGTEFTIIEGTTALPLADGELTASNVSGFPTKVRLTVNQTTGTTALATVGSITKSNATGASTTVSGTYTGTTNKTFKVRVASVDAASPKNVATWEISSDNGATYSAAGTSTALGDGLTLGAFTAGTTDAVVGDTFTFTATAATTATPTTLDLTKALFVETNVPATGVDVLDLANNKQKAAVKVSVSK